MVHTLKKLRFQRLTLILLLVHLTMARPGGFQEYGQQFQENKCNNNDHAVIEVCQRCAKQTKSPIVYPMCCENDDDAFNWCDKYINYGKQA